MQPSCKCGRAAKKGGRMINERIIIDTDIGDDIDDAFAIAYAVKSGLLIEGITTVFRNSEKRAKIAKALLRTFGREDITVCAGTDTPLVAPVRAMDKDSYSADGKFIPCQYRDEMDSEVFDERHAVDFIIEKANEFPGEITLVAIGPLTNVALAIRKAPDIIKKLKGITVMGGYFTCNKPEWNILCDPEAARIVFSSDIPLRAVGLDVTLKCRLEKPLLEKLRTASDSSSELLFSMMDQWFRHYEFECPVLHDPLTIGTIVCNSFVIFEEQPVLVMLDRDQYGITAVKEDTAEYGCRKIWVAVSVDPDSYLNDFIRKVF